MGSLVNNVQLLFLIARQKKAALVNRKTLLKLQDKRFRKIVRYVLKKSPFYKEYYKKHGINQKVVPDLSITDLPFIDKKILMENFNELVCDQRIRLADLKSYLYDQANYNKKYLNEYNIIHSSGSSGLAGIFLYNSLEWQILKATIVARVIDYELNIKKKNKLFFIGALNGNYGGIKLSESVEPRFTTFFPMSVTDPMETIIRRLSEFQPDVIQGYASFIYLLALEKLGSALGNNLLNINPKKIMTTVDPLTDTMERAIFKAFGVHPVNFYAAAESLVLGVKKPTCRYMHLFDDMNFYELLNENGKCAKGNEMGTLILTNLYNYTLPLIRYRMNDQFAFATAPCSCGMPFTHIECLSGRNEEFLWFKDNTGNRVFIHPQVFITLHIDGLIRFQIIQKRENQLTIRAVLQGDDSSVIHTLENFIKKLLAVKKLENTVQFRIEEVTEIRNDPQTGKFRLIIPIKENSHEEL